MDKTDVLNQFKEIFKDVLDLEKLDMKTETVAADIEEWDSLSHVQLIVAIERHYKIRFNSSEIRNWQNVGEMVDSVLKKLNCPN